MHACMVYLICRLLMPTCISSKSYSATVIVAILFTAPISITKPQDHVISDS